MGELSGLSRAGSRLERRTRCAHPPGRPAGVTPLLYVPTEDGCFVEGGSSCKHDFPQWPGLSVGYGGHEKAPGARLPGLFRHRRWRGAVGARSGGFQDVEDLFHFHDHLLDDLVVLGGLFHVVGAGELLTGAADGKALIVEQAADLADHQHVLALVIATVATALDRLELGEFLLPVAQYVRFYVTQVADFTNGEITLPWNRR